MCCKYTTFISHYSNFLSFLTFGRHRGLGGADVADFVDEGAEYLGAVGMLLAVGFDGIAQMGVAGADKQGEHHVGVGVCHGGDAVGVVISNDLWARGVGVCGVSVDEPLPKLGAILLAGFGLREEGGTDEHQGGELPEVVVFVYLYVGVGVEPTEPDGILELLLGGCLTEPMTEDEGDFVFEVADEIAADEPLGVVVGIGDVAVVQVVEGDALGAAEGVEGDADADAVLPKSDAFDDAGVVLPVLYAEQHSAANCHLANGGCGHTEEDFQLTIIYNVT